MKKYKQLSLEQRYKIDCLLSQSYKQSEIACAIGVNKSTISRELKRNVNARGKYANIYKAERADNKAQARLKTKNKSIRFTDKMLVYIRKKMIKERWSPELISHRGKMDFGEFVSHETIYQYIWTAKKSNHTKYRQDKALHTYLRHNKRRQKRKNHKQNRGCIPNRVSIEQRPEIVNKRGRIGDMEVDLMMGKNHKPGLIVITDRKTIETKLIKVETKKAKVIATKIQKKLQSVKTQIHTLTFDNDLAFAQHEKLANLLNVKTYFTRPYTSQDKGTVENRIGVIRRFFPKGTDMTKIHANTILSIERKLNNRPVRKFGYLTPKEKKLLINKVALVT